MSQRNLSVRHKQKYDTPENWKTQNPILMMGELGYEAGTGQSKLGDGVHSWNELGYTNSVAFSGQNFIAYKDGNLCQWGKAEINNCAMIITFEYPFKDNKYVLTTTIEGEEFDIYNHSNLSVDESSRSTTNCCLGANFGGCAIVNWRAEGKWK